MQIIAAYILHILRFMLLPFFLSPIEISLEGLPFEVCPEQSSDDQRVGHLCIFYCSLNACLASALW